MLKPLLTLALLLPAITHARIGETPEECAKRYGTQNAKIEGADYTRIEYAKGGLSTICYFESGKCVALGFEVIIPSRVASLEKSESRGTFTPTQIKRLLEANKGNSNWRSAPSADSPGVTYHVTEDGTLQAKTHDERVIIQTTANIEARKKLAAPDAVDEAMKGF